MNKIWTNPDNSKDRIIAFADNIIYRGNPQPELVNDYVHQIKINDIPKDLFGIPLTYIKEINYADNRAYIEVLFGRDSSEHLLVEDAEKRKEIFDFLKSNAPNLTYKVEKYSVFKAAKKPLIALLVVYVLFVYTFFMADDIESGVQYEVHGKPGLSAILFMIASLGVQKVILIFGVLMAIIVGSIIRKANNRPIVHQLILKKQTSWFNKINTLRQWFQRLLRNLSSS